MILEDGVSQEQEMDLMILVGSFQLGIFCDSVNAMFVGVFLRKQSLCLLHMRSPPVPFLINSISPLQNSLTSPIHCFR